MVVGTRLVGANGSEHCHVVGRQDLAQFPATLLGGSFAHCLLAPMSAIPGLVDPTTDQDASVHSALFDLLLLQAESVGHSDGQGLVVVERWQFGSFGSVLYVIGSPVGNTK